MWDVPNDQRGGCWLCFWDKLCVVFALTLHTKERSNNINPLPLTAFKHSLQLTHEIANCVSPLQHCEFRMRGHYHCLRPGCFFVTNITTKLPWHIKKHEKAERRAANGFKYFTKREECGRLGKEKNPSDLMNNFWPSVSLLCLFLSLPLSPYITQQALCVSANTPAFDNILPGEMCGLKVSTWERCRLIFGGWCKRIFSVFTKGERPVLANTVMLFEWFKRHETGLPHRFCCCVLHIHNGTSSPKGSLACTIWAITSKGAITSRLFSSSFCPCQKWAIRFVFVNYPACLV